MYEQNLRSYCNSAKYYKKPPVPFYEGDAKLMQNRKQLINDDSDEELDFKYRSTKRRIITEKSIGSLFFFITITIMFVQLAKVANTSFHHMVSRSSFPNWSPSIQMPSMPSNLNGFVWPLLGGLAFTVISWFIIYFDSNVPGKDPPSPFTGNFLKKSSWNFAYTSAVLNGVCVCVTIYLLQ